MVIIASPVWFPADPKKYALNAQGRQLGGNPGLAAFAAVKVSLAVFRIVGRLRECPKWHTTHEAQHGLVDGH
jgi:hypothetical protein